MKRDLFGIYIHWPYCLSKCPYCDFNSQAAQKVSEERYLAAALQELAYYYAELTTGRRVSTIFFGGGTPSLMRPETVADLLNAIGKHWPLAPDIEITLEANPSNVEATRFGTYRAAGVNRLSLGVQAFNDRALHQLGRIHTVDEARTALDIAQAHFDRVSFDMIYARPGQTATDWHAELTDVLACASGHLSLYQLTVEPGTAFYKQEQSGRLTLPDSETAAELYALTNDLCEAAGLPAYEISNHARPGEESRHNLLYWRYGEYIGIGPGAHGRLIVADVRQAMVAEQNPEKWTMQVEKKGHGLVECGKLSRLEEAQEMLMMGVRLAEGVSLANLKQDTGYTVSPDNRQHLVEIGLLKPDAGSLAVTFQGRLLLNAVTESLAEGLIEVTA
jgi:oxygen-independent coproporphyrinogen-3 oxidase